MACGTSLLRYLAATELAGLAETAGALGIATEDILEFTGVAAVIVTTDVSSAQAATSLGKLANILGLQTEDFGPFAAALVALGNAGASTESQILEIAERSGAASKLIGLSTDQLLAFASAAASVTSLGPEAAGASLQTLYIKDPQVPSPPRTSSRETGRRRLHEAVPARSADRARAVSRPIRRGTGASRPDSQLTHFRGRLR